MDLLHKLNAVILVLLYILEIQMRAETTQNENTHFYASNQTESCAPDSLDKRGPKGIAE